MTPRTAAGLEVHEPDLGIEALLQVGAGLIAVASSAGVVGVAHHRRAATGPVAAGRS